MTQFMTGFIVHDLIHDRLHDRLIHDGIHDMIHNSVVHHYKLIAPYRCSIACLYFQKFHHQKGYRLTDRQLKQKSRNSIKNDRFKTWKNSINKDESFTWRNSIIQKGYTNDGTSRSIKSIPWSNNDGISPSIKSIPWRFNDGISPSKKSIPWSCAVVQ